MRDLVIRPDSSIIQFIPLTERAKVWLEENTNAEPWQWLGSTLCVDRRVAGDLLQGIAESDLNYFWG
jgi:hypothetical protein